MTQKNRVASNREVRLYGARRWGCRLSTLILFSLVTLFLLPLSVASQDDGLPGDEVEPPHEAAPPREWATLNVTFTPPAELAAELGEKITMPVSISNNGNIAALGVMVTVEGTKALAATAVNVGDLKAGETSTVDVPMDVFGRYATPIPFSVVATADNIAYPTVVGTEQRASNLNADSYLSQKEDTILLLEQRYETYDRGADAPQPLIYFELQEFYSADNLLTIDLKPLLTGKVPKDLNLNVFYYPNEQTAEKLVSEYDSEALELTIVPPGKGYYLVEWTNTPIGTNPVGEARTSEEGISARSNIDPDLPRGWTPSYQAPVVSEFTGSVSYQYPILTPPGAASLQPNVALSYSSTNGNGMIGRLQGDEVGFGWTNTALIDVTQSLKTCSGTSVCEVEVDTDGNPNTHDPYNQYTLSFNGVGYELVHSNGKGSNGQAGRYYARGHAGMYIEYCKSPFSAYCQHSGSSPGGRSAGFWRIKTPDNTTYRLGYTANSEQEIRQGHSAPDVTNLALRWRVDTVTDRFSNAMSYTYTEDYYAGYVHPEYIHAPASYLTQITYAQYTVEFTYQGLSWDIYVDQGYGYAISWQTQHLKTILVKTGSQQLRKYELGHAFQRYGHDDNPGSAIPNQSDWCKSFNYVLDHNDPGDPDDNDEYTPDKAPLLLTIHERGSNNTVKSTRKDAEFTYRFLGTGEYDTPAGVTSDIRYCFPYLDSVEMLYGPSGSTPTVAYTYRTTQQNYQSPSVGGSILNRWANVVEKETTYSGFTSDAPTLNIYFLYQNADYGGDEDTLQGFRTVHRCWLASCGGSAWSRKELLNFLARPFANNDAMLTGRLEQRDVFKQGGAQMARTENTWALLSGVSQYIQHPILTKQIQRDYRGVTIATRTDYKYDQYGNQTEVQQFGKDTNSTPWRTLERKFVANTNVSSNFWLVNLAWRETLWEGFPAEAQINKIVHRTRYRFDNASCSVPDATPTLGLLKAEDRYLPNADGACGSGSGYLTTIYHYGGSGGAGASWQLTRVVDPGGREQYLTWVNTTQLQKTTIPIAGINYDTTYTYDTVLRWLIKEVKQPNNARTEYSYDPHARLTAVKTPWAVDGTPTVQSQSLTYADDANPFYIDDKVPAVNNITTRAFYDALGRPLQVRRWNISSDFNKAITDTQYDEYGRVICTTVTMGGTPDTFNASLNCPNQSHISYEYDELDEPIEQTAYNGATTTTTVKGRVREISDGNGELFVYEYDELGRLLKVRQPITASPSWTMTYGYDLADNLIQASGPNNAVTTITYDKLGRKVGMDDPDMGVWSYAYDASGNLSRQTDANNTRLCFYYDAGNRLTTKTHHGTGSGACPGTPGGITRATYTYYTGSSGRGLLEQVNGTSTTISFSDTFTYDYRGRVTTQLRTIDGRNYSLSTVYDPLDRPLTMTYPGGETVAIGYDREFPNTLTAGSQQLVVGLDFNVQGQLTNINRMNTGVPDTTLLYYGATDNFWLDKINHGSTGDAIPDFLYNDYDNLGNIKISQMRQSGTTETQTFSYDTVSRLTNAQATNSPANYHYTYTYGQGGNLATRYNVGNGQTRTYTYGTAANHQVHALLGISGGMTASFAYDNNGNMISRTVNGVSYTQEFDVENRLKKISTGGQDTTFHYDADGQRIVTILPGGTKIFTPFPEFEEEVPTSGNTTKRSSYFLAGQLMAVRVVTGSNNILYFTFADHLGNVSAITTSGGTLLAGSLARYEPYGGFRTQPTSNPTVTDRGFTGHKHNNTGSTDFDLIYMNARYYLPEIGRFISADTIVPDPQDPQSFNRYSYTINNPINYTDPSGHMYHDGCETEGCLSDPDTWGQNFVSYMAQQNDRASMAANALYLDYYNQFADIIELPAGSSVEYVIWQMAYTDTIAVNETIQQGGWFSNSVGQIFSGGHLDAFDVIEGSLGVILATSTGGSKNEQEGIPPYNRSAYGNWEPGTQQSVIHRDNYTCAYCGTRGGELTVDHVDSLKEHWYGQGGYAMTGAERSTWYNDPSNLVTACASCNSSKGAKKLWEYLFYLFNQ